MENQVLGLGWKRLQDDNTLEDYNIREFSEIDLSKQLCPTGRVIGTEKEANKKVEWDEIAAVVSVNFEKELKEKNTQFIKLTHSKITVENDMKNGEKDLDDHLLKHSIIEKEIESIKMTVKIKKQEIREIEETIDKKMQEKERLCESISQKSYWKKEKIEEVSTLKKSIETLGKDLNDMCSKNAKHEKLLEETQKMIEEKSVFKTFLSETITQKEALLECPVCFDTASPPIFKCSKEHLICSNCLPRMNDKCPTCRTCIRGPDKNFRLAEEIHKELLKLKDKMVEIGI